MTNRSRREFLQHSMLAVPGLVGLEALLSGRALAATASPAAGPDLQLMIGGEWAGFNLPPGIDIQQGGGAPVNPKSKFADPRSFQTQQVRFQFGAGMSKSFYNLVQQSVARVMRNADGVLLIGTTSALQAAYEWTNGAIYEIDMPPLNASINTPVYATATLKATQLVLAPAAKFAAAHTQGYATGKPGSPWRSNNFRLSCSALGTLVHTSTISGLSLSSLTAGGTASFAMVAAPAQLVSMVRPFSAAAANGGWLTPGQATSFTIELLDPTLRTTLGSVILQNCKIARIDTASAPTGSSMIATVTLTYADATPAFSSTWG